ncbi:hypothetical protein SASPL_101647 [Salvia splendens]|uniref:Uncharacterized protein n=1 Tax=Salvia splendens TaxID=180675 RepID=A0A8X8YV83_SALSN|nr:hypothetical protein SASPL_101647 [Salvia splendens]
MERVPALEKASSRSPFCPVMRQHGEVMRIELYSKVRVEPLRLLPHAATCRGVLCGHVCFHSDLGVSTRLKMPKRGRPRSQASHDADNQLRVDIDSVVDDIIPVALEKRFRERLAEIGPRTSGSQGQPKPPTVGVPTDVHTSVAATHMEVVGGNIGGVAETVHERTEITEGGNANVGSSGEESRGVREGGNEVVTTTKPKSVKVIKDMPCSDGRVKGKAENIAGLTKEMALKRGHGKQPAVTKVVTNLNLRPPLTKKKGIVIAEAGTGGISADLHLKTTAGLVKGKEKVNKAKEAVRSEASNIETARLFFPIWGKTHQYVVCFDVPDGKMNIIDHTLTESHASFGEKYGDTPSMLV